MLRCSWLLFDLLFSVKKKKGHLILLFRVSIPTGYLNQMTYPNPSRLLHNQQKNQGAKIYHPNPTINILGYFLSACFVSFPNVSLCSWLEQLFYLFCFCFCFSFNMTIYAFPLTIFIFVNVSNGCIKSLRMDMLWFIAPL